MQNRFVKAAMDGLKPCITGIILSTGIMMIAGNAGLLPGESVNIPALCLTAGLSAVYFGSGAIIKKRISPIALIIISALAGVIVYGNRFSV